MKRNIATFLLLLVALTGYGMFVVNAAPPTTQYDPGETLDPGCAPGDVNCSVRLITHVEGGLAGTGTVADKIRLTFLFENDAKGIVSLGTGASSDSSKPIGYSLTKNRFHIPIIFDSLKQKKGFPKKTLI